MHSYLGVAPGQVRDVLTVVLRVTVLLTLVRPVVQKVRVLLTRRTSRPHLLVSRLRAKFYRRRVTVRART